jgi:hypothetical protein
VLATWWAWAIYFLVKWTTTWAGLPASVGPRVGAPLPPLWAGPDYTKLQIYAHFISYPSMNAHKMCWWITFGGPSIGLRWDFGLPARAIRELYLCALCLLSIFIWAIWVVWVPAVLSVEETKFPELNSVFQIEHPKMLRTSGSSYTCPGIVSFGGELCLSCFVPTLSSPCHPPPTRCESYLLGCTEEYIHAYF